MAGDNVNVNFNTIGSLPPLPVSFNQLGSNGCFAKIEHGSLPPQRMAKIRPRCWSLPSQSAVSRRWGRRSEMALCPHCRHSSDENAAPRTNGSNAKAALRH
jgi:hypothetical protein